MAEPWFKFFPMDFLFDTRVDGLSLEAQAILVRLWCLCWRDQFIPDDPKALARRAMVDPKPLIKNWNQLRVFFELVSEGLVSPRMERERACYTAVINKCRSGAAITNAKRWGNRSASESPSDNGASQPSNAEDVAQRSHTDTDTEEEVHYATAPCGIGVAEPLGLEAPEAPAKAKKARPVKSPKPETQRLDEILGGKGSQNFTRYWKFAGIWNPEKNPSPKALALEWNRTCAKENPKAVYLAALNYRERFEPPARPADETRFMKSPLAWLQEEGWKVELQAAEADMVSAVGGASHD